MTHIHASRHDTCLGERAFPPPPSTFLPPDPTMAMRVGGLVIPSMQTDVNDAGSLNIGGAAPAGLPMLVQLAAGARGFRLLDAAGHAVREGEVAEVRRLAAHHRFRVTFAGGAASEVQGRGIGLRGAGGEGSSFMW